MIKRFFHKFIYAPLSVCKEALVAFGALAGLYQGVILFLPYLKCSIIPVSGFAIAIALIIYGRLRTWKPSKIDFAIPHTNTTIEIIFGDLFQQKGLKAIPVSEFFDSTIGDLISPQTLHGIFIQKHLNGQNFDSLVFPSLNKTPFDTDSTKKEGNSKFYPIGTTVRVTTDAEYLLFALAKTNPQTLKVYCDVPTMWNALDGLWQKARETSGGGTVNIPLVGSGQSGVGLPARELLNLIVLSIIRTTQKEKIAPKIRIILQKDRFEELDLRKIKQNWKE
jgi:hypothetical protein